MFVILFFGIFPHLFLYTIEFGQMAFVVTVILITVSVIVKILKNRKIKNPS